MGRGPLLCALSAIVMCIATAATAATAVAAGTLHTMKLPNSSYSYATAISADGLTVGGSSDLPTDRVGWRWTAAGGIVPLGTIPNSNGLTAYDPTGISADGSVIVGAGYRWTKTGGLAALNAITFPGGISADGNVATGAVYHQYDNSFEAARWTVTAGTQRLGDFEGTPFHSQARDVSADGQIVVGFGYPDPWEYVPFRWTQQTGLVNLGLLPGGRNGQAQYVSDDGSTIVGTCWYLGDENRFFDQVFRWTEQAGMTPLIPYSPLNDDMNVADVSGDGTVIIGRSITIDARGFFYHWTPQTGVRDIRDVFAEAGIDLTGYTINDLSAVSADGRTFAGGMMTPSGDLVAFVATIPEPASAALILPAAVALLARRRRGK